MEIMINKNYIMRIGLIAGLLFFSVVISAQEIKKIKINELEMTIKESKKPLIVNFWATFCIPCIEEIPYFEELSKKHDVELLLVSLDLEDFYPDKIKKFAAKNKFTASMAWLDEYDADYFCPRVDTSWSGAIPASLFVNNQTGYRKFFEEQISKDKLEKEIMAILGKEN
jgi:thiol-disulfide isomerase/thioredoxin